MDDRRRIRFALGKIDLVLIGVALMLVATGGILLWLSSAWWGCYLSALDVRLWPPWKCIGLAVILVETLLVIRYWPNKQRRRPAVAKGHEE